MRLANTAQKELKKNKKLDESFIVAAVYIDHELKAMFYLLFQNCPNTVWLKVFLLSLPTKPCTDRLIYQVHEDRVRFGSLRKGPNNYAKTL